MQQSNSREDGDGKPHTQAAGASLWVVLEIKPERDIYTCTCMHMHTRTRRFMEVRRCRKHLNKATNAESCSLPPSPSGRMEMWVGAATYLGDHPSATLNWGSWQKGGAGRAHAGTRKAKELKPSPPVKKCGWKSWLLHGLQLLLVSKEKETSLGCQEQVKGRKEEWKSLQGSLEVRHPKGRSHGAAGEVKTRKGEICN